MLTEEELQTALEQGDITRAEFDDLIESFRSRIAADSTLIDHPAAIPDLPDASGTPPIAVGYRGRQTSPSAPTPTTLSYQTTIPIRGTATESHIVGIRPTFGPHTANIEITRRGAHEWHTRTARATFHHRSTTLTLGAFDTRWTGGLLIGPAPSFLDTYDTIGETILHPQRGRLNGAMLSFGEGTDITTVTSYHRDNDLTHTTYGAEARYRIGSINIESALLHQSLRARTGDRQFTADLLGLSLNTASGPAVITADIAANRHSIAAQGTLHTAGLDYEFDLRAWHIPGSFRHPLLAARTESDRESIDYPELGRTISSASTGERGFRAHLRFGPPQTEHTIALTHWRESSQHRAAIRLRLIRKRVYRTAKWTTHYYLHVRPNFDARDYRHELSTRIERRRFTTQVKFRYIDGLWSPFGRYSAQFKLTWRTAETQPSRGRITATIALDRFNFQSAHTTAWTIVLGQRLRTGHLSQLDLHLRIRTAYRDNPRSITLRIVSGVVP